MAALTDTQQRLLALVAKGQVHAAYGAVDIDGLDTYETGSQIYSEVQALREAGLVSKREGPHWKPITLTSAGRKYVSS